MIAVREQYELHVQHVVCNHNMMLAGITINMTQ